MSDSITTLEQLKAKTANSGSARNRLTYLFDEGSFTELDAYLTSGSELAGVITAFGYVEGNPVYAFSQDTSAKSGAMTAVQAEKIAKVYDLAAKTGVPVVGIFDSLGADVSNSGEALNAYGKLLMWSSNLSGVVPQIAVVAGVCTGSSAILAETADFTVVAEDAQFYESPNGKENYAEIAAANGTASIVAVDDKEAIEKAKEILNKLPQNNLSPVPMYEFAEPTANSGVEAVFDDDSILELSEGYGKSAYTALATLGGATVGVVSTDKSEDKLNSDDCAKIARFVRICDAYAIPVITFVDTEGFAADEKAGAVKAMSMAAHAYAEATTIKISVVTGKAYGPAFIALAGKGANADLTYASTLAAISALNPLTAVEFLHHDELKGAKDLTADRNALADKYVKENASAAQAAADGCVDGVIETSEIRRTLVNSIEILAGKRLSRLPKKHSNIQL